MIHTSEQAIGLAPDAASAAAGRGLASAAKWEGAGRNPELAWGEAKGSGARPYQTVVALADGASRCSCPSRKFPCKHALGLLLRVVAGEVAEGEPPVWATEWRDKRSQRAEKTEAAPRVPDPKTTERRWANVLRGLDECEAFLRDAVGDGLLSAHAARSWDEMARRMVDAQAPGAARRLRLIGERIGVGSDWAPRVAGEVGSLALLLAAARRVDELGELGDDVRTALGLPARAEGEEAVGDVWDVHGVAADLDDRLWTRRTWLRGRETERWALHLGFASGGSPPPPLAPFGTAIFAEARFAASAWPLRATFGGGDAREFDPRRGGTWADALDAQADALARHPWVELFPVLLRDAALGREDGGWLAVDADGVGVPLANADDERNRLLARTGNRPADLFGEFDGERLRVLSYREALP